MKTLTLTQPYATLIAIGTKRIETRSWLTSYRGPLAIHAAAGLGPVGGKSGLMDVCRTEPFRSALVRAGILGTPSLPLGAIVAMCELVDCVATWPDWAVESPWFTGVGEGATWHVPPPEPEHSFGDYTSGRYAWLLADVRALPEPIPARGALGLWAWTPPEGFEP